MEVVKGTREIRKIAVLGAGSWGTALASVLSRPPVRDTPFLSPMRVVLWARRKSCADEIAKQHMNSQYLGRVQLPNSLWATSDLQAAVQDADVLLFAVPAVAMRMVAKMALPWICPDVCVVHAAKGFEPGTRKRMSEVLKETLPVCHRLDPVALAGPSHAEEVVRSLPVATVAASPSLTHAQILQALLSRPHFRVYTNTDIIGVEIAGALKNIVALASGLADGLQLGDNAKAALLTRGLAEICRFGQLQGARMDTFLGLAGVGDLVVTCNSQHSRNLRAGRLFSQGMDLEHVLRELGMVVEGIETTRSVHRMAQQLGVTMPITAALYEVLFSQGDPRQIVQQLMQRQYGREYSPGTMKNSR
ncbi:NAD(P)H-dependent glycerol-3-phosphate dehydrogenase [Pasteuria penetrans]|uniref:NAD(P)H-dependent glycerol-3-phosphate dehydrogenase n=1 Tax=Pasteuria penetrans TaxID=86005 RepID=UPI001FE43401|nr:NAD(P)H-dependent glycerol-3-phosphate dehydrogenase [Pasteuria penetrans]